jgi:hypothetical protein
MDIGPADQQLCIELIKALAVEMRHFGYGSVGRSSFELSSQDIEDMAMPRNGHNALPVRGASFDHGFQSTYRHVSHLLLQLGICEGLPSGSGRPEFFRFLLDYDELDEFLMQRKPWEVFSLPYLAGAYFHCDGKDRLIERHGFIPGKQELRLAESFCLAGYAKRREHGFEWLADDIDIGFEPGGPVWLGFGK